MKKIRAAFLLLVCLIGLTACGGSGEKMDALTQLNYQSIANMCYTLVTQDIPEENREEIRSYSAREWDSVSANFAAYSIYVDGDTFLAGLESWWGAAKEMGTVSGPADIEKYKVVRDGDTVSVTIPVDAAKHDAVMEILFDENMDIKGITTNVSYSFGEKMAKAGLNTLMGMGTVFVVLILISLIISAFSLISKLQKKPSGAETKKDAVDNTIAQISEREEEELSDNLELVAVISAAIAAAEGASGTDGFVVRSIRRVSRR